MVDNIKPTKIGPTSYVRGKSAAISNSGAATKTTDYPVDSMLSEKLERVIQSLSDDSGDVDDTARVNFLKGQLRQGTYVVNTNQVADDILQEYPPVLVSADSGDE